MKILVLNSGSSSIKSALFDCLDFPANPSSRKSGESLIKTARILIDNLGSKNCRFIFEKLTGTKIHNSESCQIKNHEQGVKLILDTLLKTRTISNLKEISAIGHRVVHGGEKYTNPTPINKNVLSEIAKLSSLAPLHNPANLASIKAATKLLPKARHVAVFDTAFHQTMPEKAYLYAVPEKFHKKHHIRRYGFHGISHQYIINETIKLLKKNSPDKYSSTRLKNIKIISCHLGNGSSITASIGGKCIDTSMGFTPMEGLPMGTRSGSIDPGIILHLQNFLKIPPAKIDEILNHQSGLLAISGLTSDMRDIYRASLKNPKTSKTADPASLAIEILSYQIAKYCGSYAAAMNGLDALTFTGGIGEHAFYIREKACNYLDFLGLKLDLHKNRQAIKAKFTKISTPSSKTAIFIIPTDEEKQIALETILKHRTATKFSVVP